jgi:hypothetical protein
VRHVVDEVTSASRPVTDTVGGVLRPVTGTVETVTGARPVSAVVDTVDHVVGSVPVVGTVLGDGTLGTVTGPVTDLVDDTLGSVGTTVGTVPDLVEDVVPSVGGSLPGGTDPVIDVPGLPVGGGTTPATGPVPTAPAGSTQSGGTPVQGTPAAATPESAGPSVALRAADLPAALRPTEGAAVVALGPVAAVDTPAVQDATLGDRALLVPGDRDVDRTPFDGRGAGVLGGSASSTTGGVAAVGIVGSTDDIVSLAAGSRGTLSDDAVPASVVGEHDVAPD